MELAKILKVFLERSRGKVGQICTDCLGGGRMVMAKSLFLKLCRFLGESCVENSPICVDFFRIRQSLSHFA